MFCYGHIGFKAVINSDKPPAPSAAIAYATIWSHMFHTLESIGGYEMILMRSFALVLGALSIPYFFITLDAYPVLRNNKGLLIIVSATVIITYMAFAFFLKKRGKKVLLAQSQEEDPSPPVRTDPLKSRILQGSLKALIYIALFLAGGLAGGILIAFVGGYLRAAIWLRPVLMLLAFSSFLGCIAYFVISKKKPKDWGALVFAALFLVALSLLAVPAVVSRGINMALQAPAAKVVVPELWVKPDNIAGLLTMTGKGKRTLSNGEVYTGTFSKGLPDGKGKFTWKNGTVYEGDVLRGKLTGKGKMVTSYGETYVGDFVNGLHQGKGKMKYYNGNTYEGDFVDDQCQGQGKRTWGGNIYEGSFVKGHEEGKGKLTYSWGVVFEGEFVNGVPGKTGKVTYPNGSIYEGEVSATWLFPDGQGKLTWPNGDVYEGEFENRVENGHGKLTWADGTTFEGTWVNGIPEGQGTYTCTDGYVETGVFKNGKLSITCPYCGNVETIVEITSSAQ